MAKINDAYDIGAAFEAIEDELIVTEIGVKNIVGCFDDLHTCLVAELTGHISVLSGEGEDNIHHNEGRYERKWFQYCPQHSDSPP